MPTCIIPLKEYFILTFRFERWTFRFGHYIAIIETSCHHPVLLLLEIITFII